MFFVLYRFHLKGWVSLSTSSVENSHGNKSITFHTDVNDTIHLIYQSNFKITSHMNPNDKAVNTSCISKEHNTDLTSQIIRRKHSRVPLSGPKINPL